MFHVKMSFGKVKVERWIDADSIVSVEGKKKDEAKKDKSLLPKAGFLSSQEQWSRRAALQQGIDSEEEVDDSDSIVSVKVEEEEEEEVEKDKALLERAGFLSSQEQWSQRAARQQGIDTEDEAVSGSV